MDGAFSLVEALAVCDGKAAAVGTTNEIRSLRGAGTRIFDLKGRTVLPASPSTR